MPKQPITALRLMPQARQNLEHIAEMTGRSMCEVVEHLVQLAVKEPGTWPPKSGRRRPPSGTRWRVSRLRGSAFLNANFDAPGSH